jgi:hypothetical protein
VNKNLKIGLLLGAGFAAYKLYNIYQLGEKIEYTPVDFNYSNSKIYLKMRLDNPVNATLKMRGVDGTIALEDGRILSSFTSEPFIINQGVSYFTLIFDIDPIKAGVEILKMLISFNTPKMIVTMKKKIPFITITETFVIDPAKLKK